MRSSETQIDARRENLAAAADARQQLREELRVARTNARVKMQSRSGERARGNRGSRVDSQCGKEAWLIEKKRTEGISLAFTQSSKRQVRAVRLAGRSDLEAKYLSEKADLELEVRNLSAESGGAKKSAVARKVVHELHTSLKSLTDNARGAMNEAEVQADEMADEISRLKQDLILAKQYKLHTVMEKVTKAGIKEQNRLKRIIAHMQAEKLAMQTILVDAENQSDQALKMFAFVKKMGK